MKKFKIIAVLCSTMMFINQGMLLSNAETVDDNAEVIISDTSEKLYTISYNTNGGNGKITQNEPSPAGESVKLSVWALQKEGYAHTGWTDGENVYERGEIIEMPEKNLALKAVWTRLYTLSYEDFSYLVEKLPLSDATVVPGTEIYLPNYALFKGEARFNGWLVNGVYHEPLSYFTMPEEDVYIEISWSEPLEFTYYSGDVEGCIGADKVTFTKYGGFKFQLSDSTRLARLGYKLTGWYDADEDVSYDLEDTYCMPDKNKIIYAIWTPIKVAVSFLSSEGSGSMERQIIDYDSIITLPECKFVNDGYKLLGWNLKGNYYEPESKFQIKIDKMGEALKFNAVWIEEDINPGDINLDGSCDLTDLTLLSLHILKDREITDENILKNADVRRDDAINLADLAYYRQYLTGAKILLGMKGESE